MAGLVGYASSEDDDDEENEIIEEAQVKQASNGTSAAPAPFKLPETNQLATASSEKAQDKPLVPPQPKEEDPVVIGPVQQNAVPLGPSLPPMGEPLMDESDPDRPPLSPYSANRSLLRDLTLPSVPNLDIPPSPPGSPPRGVSKKFEQFLELKKKGVHFNAKLENSTSLKNPSLMDKLMEFVGIDEQGQYSTTLSTDLWDPNGFPEWASKDKLKKAQEKVAKEKEAERASGSRTTVEFVPSTTPATTGNSSGGGGLARGEKRKSAWK